MTRDNNKIIVIFDQGFHALAFVSLNAGPAVEFVIGLSQEGKDKVAEIVNNSKTNPPRIRKEMFTSEGAAVGFESIDSEDDLLLGISQELKLSGFMNKIVPEFIKSILVQVSTELTIEQRTTIIGELVNLPDDVEGEALEELQNVLHDLASITPRA